MKKLTVSEIAQQVGGELVGDGSAEITGVASLDNAQPDQISFLNDKKYYNNAVESKAGVIIIPKVFEGELPDGRTFIKSENPNGDFSQMVNFFAPAPPEYPKGIHPTAIVHETANVPESCHVGPYAIIGKGTVIGENTKILEGVIISEDVKIGNECLIYQGVVIRERSIIGNGVIIHCNAVIGADGFAYNPSPFGLVKVPQLGIVQIDDDVEIGANATIDRARFGKTWIKMGVKIDNLVMVAHNCVVGECSILIGQTGLAGSVKVGQGAIFGGQAAASHGLTIGDGAKIAGQGGVTQNVAPGAILGGTPAIPVREALKQKRVVKTLDKYKERLSNVEAELKELKALLNK